MKFWDGAADPS